MLATLCEEIYTARRPWETTDAATMMKCTDQSAIDRCLCCCHASSACDYCDGRGNVRIPKKQENLDTLRELMKLRLCHAEMARKMQVSRPTLYRMMAKLQAEV